MHDTEIFFKNLDRLMKMKEIRSDAELVDKVNTKHNSKVVTPPYISKIRKSIKQGKPQNVTLEFIGYFANFFGIPSFKMLKKGFDDETSQVDFSLLFESVKYALLVSDNVGIKDPDFISDVTSATYTSIMKNDKDNLAFQILRLVRPYVSHTRP